MREAISKILKRDEEQPVQFFDEDLDNDEVDLKEWAFWQGYYGET